MDTAECVKWDNDEGWGVLRSEAVPGDLFAHFSAIQVDGYASLAPGEQVLIDWEEFPAGQDGFYYRARRVEKLTTPA